MLTSIKSVGSYVPSGILTNADLEKMVETSDTWIRDRTGIVERRIAAVNETATDLAAEAAKDALAAAGLRARRRWPRGPGPSGDPDGRAKSLPLRHGDPGPGDTPGVGEGQRPAGGRQADRPPPGQRPHHRSGRQAAWRWRGRHGQRDCVLRQHVDGVDTAGAQGRTGRGPAENW